MSSTFDLYLKIIIFASHGLLLFFKNTKIEVIDETLKEQEYDYLRLEGKISYSIDDVYNLPRIEIPFDEWYVNNVLLWSKIKRSSHTF